MINLDNLNKPQFIINTDNILIQNIIGYWYCNEGSGSNIFDNSGNKNNCDVLAFPINTAWQNNRPILNGVNDRLEVVEGKNTSPNQEMSFLIWCKVLGYPNRPDLFKAISTKTTSTAWNDGFGIISEPGSSRDLRFFINHWNNNIAKISNFDTYLNQWVFIAGTYDKKNIKLYINGSLEASSSYISTISTTSHALELGRANNDNFCINMLIDQFIYFNKALTFTDIMNFYINPYFLIKTQFINRLLLLKGKYKL